MRQYQILFMLHWPSLLAGGSDIVAAILTHKGGRYCDYSLIWSHSCGIIQDGRTNIVDAALTLVLATAPGNPPAVRVWTTQTGRFGSRPGQKPDLLTLRRPNPDPYRSTLGIHRVWLDPSGPISGTALRVSHVWSHSDMLLLLVKYWHWYVTVHFRHSIRLDVQYTNTHAPNHILTMSVNRASTERQQSVNRASTIFGLASLVIWVVLDQTHPYRRIWQAW